MITNRSFLRRRMSRIINLAKTAKISKQGPEEDRVSHLETGRSLNQFAIARSEERSPPRYAAKIPAIDVKFCARDVGRLVGGQEQDRVGDLIHLAGPAERHRLQHLRRGPRGRRWRPRCASAASARDGSELQRIRSLPNCTAVDLVMIRTAPFAAL